MSEPDYIDPAKLQPGPIRHESLPSELLEQIEAIYEVIGRYLNMNLEEFEIGFRRDARPDGEVAIWLAITAAWIAYHEHDLNDVALPAEDERRLLAALIAISSGVEDDSKLGVPFEVAGRLRECLSELDDDED